MAKAYSKQMDENNILLLREILSELPQYVTITFRGIENTTSTRTRLGYSMNFCANTIHTLMVKLQKI